MGTPLFLTPDPDTPLLEGDALEDFIQLTLVGITGYPPALVRPGYQPTPPTQPTVTTDWMAFSLAEQDPDANAYFKQIPAEPGSTAQYMQRQETIELFNRFYGPNSKAFAAILRDGLAMPQNRDLLRTQGIAVVKTDRIIRTSELISEQYVKRHDMTVMLRRQIERVYEVNSIAEAAGTVRTESYTYTFDTAKERQS